MCGCNKNNKQATVKNGSYHVDLRKKVMPNNKLVRKIKKNAK